MFIYYAYINCRSLIANIPNLKILLENLHISFDVTALTDRWLSVSNTDFFHLEWYDVCHRNRNTKQGGGVLFFIKRNIKYATLEQFAIDIENCLKCIILKLLFGIQIIVSCLYRKPSSKIAGLH